MNAAGGRWAQRGWMGAVRHNRRVHISERADGSAALNAIARVRGELTESGIAVTELSDSNPTRHGLLHPGVLQAVARHAGDAARYDPQPRGARSAREALAARFGGEADDYWLTASTSQSYAWLLAVLTDPGEAVAAPAPGYPLVAPLARLSGARTAEYRLHYAHPHGWVLDTASLAAAVASPGLRAVIAVNPGNPTGAYVGGTIDDIARACAPRGLPLIADEVFAPFALDGTASSVAGERRIVTITLGGVSKLLCAPQLKAAWIRLEGPEEALPPLRAALDAVADTFLPVSGPIAAALPELLALADPSVEATLRRLRTNLAETRRVFAGTGFRVRRCDGGWNVIVDAPRAAVTGGPGSDGLAVRLLRHAHLAVHPGWFYDLARDGALVVSLLPEPEDFADRLARLRRAVEDLAA